jgi:hypothetical protein
VARLVVLDRLGVLERLHEPVAQRDRLRQRLEADRVLREPGDRQRARGRAERDDELVVVRVSLAPSGERIVTSRSRGSAPSTLRELEVACLQLLAQRHDDVARLQRARPPRPAAAACRA